MSNSAPDDVMMDILDLPEPRYKGDVFEMSLGRIYYLMTDHSTPYDYLTLSRVSIHPYSPDDTQQFLCSDDLPPLQACNITPLAYPADAGRTCASMKLCLKAMAIGDRIQRARVRRSAIVSKQRGYVEGAVCRFEGDWKEYISAKVNVAIDERLVREYQAQATNSGTIVQGMLNEAHRRLVVSLPVLEQMEAKLQHAILATLRARKR